MILATLLAHLFGDYIFQWDGLSQWKSESFAGVLFHGLIVLSVTLTFTILVDVSWWLWAMLIGVTHTMIDALGLPFRKRFAGKEAGLSAAAFFISDQVIHLGIIVIALIGSGYLAITSVGGDLAAAASDHQTLAFVVGFAFLTMPAWVLLKFAVYGLVKVAAPDFSQGHNYKYLAMMERILIAFVVIGGSAWYFIFLPLIVLHRLLGIWGNPAVDQDTKDQDRALNIADLLASTILAVAVGLALRSLTIGSL